MTEMIKTFRGLIDDKEMNGETAAAVLYYAAALEAETNSIYALIRDKVYRYLPDEARAEVDEIMSDENDHGEKFRDMANYVINAAQSADVTNKG